MHHSRWHRPRGRALIIGAGIAGPAAGMALQRAGCDVVIFEAHPPRAAAIGPLCGLEREFRTRCGPHSGPGRAERAQETQATSRGLCGISRAEPLAGSYLTVATNGVDALRAIGAHDPVLRTAFPTSRTVLMNGSGKRLGVVPIGSTRPGRDASCTIRRADLQHGLQSEAARRGIPVAFGKRLADADPTPSGVTARFEDGTNATGDFLVGCDGIHSPTRSIIDPRAPAPRYVGLLNFGGYTPGMALGEPGAWHMIFGARAFFGYVPDPTGGTVWFANVPRQAASSFERASTSADTWRARLLDLFAADAGPAAALIRAGRIDLAADNTHDLPQVPVWHRGRMILIGDAAHAPSPSSGQGASMALEDAVVLAQCVRDTASIPTAFATFVRLRRKRTERIVQQGARSSSSKAAGPVLRVLRDMTLPFVCRHLITESSQAWIYEHHVDWNTRVARE